MEKRCPFITPDKPVLTRNECWQIIGAEKCHHECLISVVCSTCDVRDICDSERLWATCCDVGSHSYSPSPCQGCGHNFCYDCSTGYWRDLNPDGGDVTKCPNCGLEQPA